MNCLRIIFLLSIFSLGCQIKTQRGSERGSDSPAGATSPTGVLVDPKYSLAKDRSDFEQLRQSIPVDKKNKNDEKALMDEWFQQLKYPPATIREKYSDLLRKKRDLFNRDMQKSRESFNKKERQDREEFTKSLENERKNFLKEKVDQSRRSEFFNQQDEKRRSFSSDQKDRRDEFESDVREKRKNFEDYAKEKSDEFNAELKSYTQRWNELQQKKNP
jgi:hypothetical protein